jgi:hypothetical protein
MITPPENDPDIQRCFQRHMSRPEALEVSGTTTATEIDSSTPQRPVFGEETHSAYCGKESICPFR